MFIPSKGFHSLELFNINDQIRIYFYTVMIKKRFDNFGRKI